MLRHVVCFTWKDAATPAAIDELTAALHGLPAQIPEIRAYHVGPDVALEAGNADFAIVSDFDDPNGWRRYQEHPAHQAVRTELMRPLVASRAAVQYEWS